VNERSERTKATASRVAVVTGASSGIGAATVQALAALGHRVLATGRDGDALAAVAAASAGPGPIEVLAVDLTESGAAGAVIDEARRRFGPVQVLVNNAGRPGWGEQAIWEQPDEVWRDTLALNLDVPFRLTKLGAADMRATGWGRVVMVSSTAGEVGAPMMSAYCASKAGLLGLMRSAAQDLGTFGATCNAVLPGWVRTPMADDDARWEAERRSLSIDEVWRERDATYPRGAVLQPDEVAQVIAWLVGDGAAGINGEAVRVALGGVW
jgi:NAD(P)-dependent dehydrogenase (short-subunit alcohol dehydrogenase family)